MKRFAALAYGTICYAIFFATFLYTAGFLANFWVGTTIDGGGSATGPIWTAVAIDVGLLAIFGLQHSVMARIGFKKWWTKFVPQQVERSTYVLLSSAAMILLIAFWQPIPAPILSAGDAAARAFFYGLYIVGLALVLYSTFLIDHFDLFGLRQVWLYFRGRPYTEKSFKTPSLYKYVRHPLYVGWFTVLWATPDMTVGHFLMAAVATTYIVVAVLFEEQDLKRLLGEPYRRYCAATPRYLPRLGRRASTLPVGQQRTA